MLDSSLIVAEVAILSPSWSTQQCRVRAFHSSPRREPTCEQVWQGLHAHADELDVACNVSGQALSQGSAVLIQIIQHLMHLCFKESVGDCVASPVIALQKVCNVTTLVNTCVPSILML